MRAHTAILGVLLAALIAGTPLAAQAPASLPGPIALEAAPSGPADAQKQPAQPDLQQPGSKDTKKKAKGGFVWDGRPSLRFGKAFRMDFRLKLQGDLRASVQDLSEVGGTFEMGRKRTGIKGTLFQDIDYEVERDLDPAGEWRDVYVNVGFLKFAQVQGGKFKIPFSSEALTGATDLDFMYRARVVDMLAPARDVGVMVHGRLFKRVLQYWVGGFRHDGGNPPSIEPLPLLPGETFGPRGRSYAARLVIAPLRAQSGSTLLKTLELGGAFVTATVPEGPNHLQGRSALDFHFYPRSVYVNGQRLRTGFEVNWTPGPVSIRMEHIRSSEAREGQGVGNEQQLDNDLAEFVGQGWYVSGTWVLTGEKTEGGVEARKPLFQGGFGAIQVGARYEALQFGTPSGEGSPSRSVRAARAPENSDRVLTLGVNWYVNRWVRLQFNGIREQFLDPERSPVPGQPSFWSTVCRLQFVL